jgi:hypothetical protein
LRFIENDNIIILRIKQFNQSDQILEKISFGTKTVGNSFGLNCELAAALILLYNQNFMLLQTISSLQILRKEKQNCKLHFLII